jgi:hypothetical protein
MAASCAVLSASPRVGGAAFSGSPLMSPKADLDREEALKG